MIVSWLISRKLPCLRPRTFGIGTFCISLSFLSSGSVLSVSGQIALNRFTPYFVETFSHRSFFALHVYLPDLIVAYRSKRSHVQSYLSCGKAIAAVSRPRMLHGFDRVRSQYYIPALNAWQAQQLQTREFLYLGVSKRLITSVSPARN